MGAKKTALDRSRKKSRQRVTGLDYIGFMNYEYEGPLRVLPDSGKKILIVWAWTARERPVSLLKEI